MRWLLISLLAVACSPKPSKSIKLTEVPLSMMQSALSDLTVERRLSNLLVLFEEGNFASCSTLMVLAGIPKAHEDERDDQTQLRLLLNEIVQITRLGDDFLIRLKSQKDIRQKIYIYGLESGQYKKHEWEVFVSKNAKIMIKRSKNGIKVNAKGIRIGYGWLKVDVPSMRIKTDHAFILGVRVDLSRK